MVAPKISANNALAIDATIDQLSRAKSNGATTIIQFQKMQCRCLASYIETQVAARDYFSLVKSLYFFSRERSILKKERISSASFLS